MRRNPGSSRLDPEGAQTQADQDPVAVVAGATGHGVRTPGVGARAGSIRSGRAAPAVRAQPNASIRTVT